MRQARDGALWDGSLTFASKRADTPEDEVSTLKSPWKLGKIAVIQDALLPKEKLKALTSVLNELRKDAEIELLKSTTTEEALLTLLQKNKYSAVLAPHTLYFDWEKVERHFGRTRTSGPVFVGYAADRFTLDSLPQAPRHLKILFLDLGHLLPQEARILLVNTIDENRRSGIRSFFENKGIQVHFENWHKGAHYGDRADQVLALPTVTQHGWSARTVDFRIAHLALWNLIFHEDSHPKEPPTQVFPVANAKGQFQVALERGVFVLRLCVSMPSWKITDLLSQLYPVDQKPTDPLHLLMRHTDFLRINLIADTPLVEITCGYFPSHPSIRYPLTQRSLCVQTLASSLVHEIPMQNASKSDQEPMIPLRENTEVLHFHPESQAHDKVSKPNVRVIENLHFELKRLRELLADRESTIRELKSGGVGASVVIEPPDVEALLESFQDRYAVARYQIEQFHEKLQILTLAKASPHAIVQVQQSLQLLLEREQVWIQTIAKILQTYREDQEKRSKRAA